MYFEKALDATAADRREHIECNSVFEVLQSGRFTWRHYIAYLKETYHLVRHTPRFLALTAGRLGDGDRWLREWCLDFARDEKGHDLLCVNDLRVLGEDPAVVLAQPPLGGAWAMITQNYYIATYGNPVALIGFAVATEGLGASAATMVAEMLQTRYGVPRQATSFLRVHGVEDYEHLDGAKKALEEYAADPTHYADILHVWQMTLRAYGQLFRDVVGAEASQDLCGAVASVAPGVAAA